MPQLDDPNFRRTVVLLVHHGSDGSFGIVLNRSLDLSLDGVLRDAGITWPGEPSSVGWGGPVRPELGWVVFAGDRPANAKDDEVTSLGDGLCVTGSLDMLRAVAAKPPTKLRLFLGYAGWGPGQLEREMAENAWLCAPIDPIILFHTPSDQRWAAAAALLGVDLNLLSSDAGHA